MGCDRQKEGRKWGGAGTARVDCSPTARLHVQPARLQHRQPHHAHNAKYSQSSCCIRLRRHAYIIVLKQLPQDLIHQTLPLHPAPSHRRTILSMTLPLPLALPLPITPSLLLLWH